MKYLKSTRNRVAAGLVAILILSIALVAACSGGSGGAASASSCNIKIATTASGSVFLVVTNPGGSVTASECSAVASQSSEPDQGATSSVVGSLPSGLAQSCTGASDGLSYVVYGDGSSTGAVLASAACAAVSN